MGREAGTGSRSYAFPRGSASRFTARMQPTRTAALLLTLAAASGSPVALAAPAAPGAVSSGGSSSDAPPPAHTAAIGTPSSPDDPQPLPTAGSVNVRLPESGNAAYAFEADGPGVLKVAVGGEADLVLAVATPEGIEAAAGFSDQDLEGDWSESVEVPIVAAGRYLVHVTDYDAAEGGAGVHLAAAFEAGEPEPSDTLSEADIAFMRSLAAPGTLNADADADGVYPITGLAVMRIDAAPGVYAVVAVAAEDIELSGASAGSEPALDAWSVPALAGYGQQASDADLGGAPGLEALVLDVPEEGSAFVAVGGYDGVEGSFRLRLQRLTVPDAAD